MGSSSVSSWSVGCLLKHEKIKYSFSYSYNTQHLAYGHEMFLFIGEFFSQKEIGKGVEDGDTTPGVGSDEDECYDCDLKKWGKKTANLTSIFFATVDN